MPEKIVEDLRLLTFDVERAYHSWTIFQSSTRNFEATQQTLIDAIDARNIGLTVNHLQMVLLHDCVSCLCRVTDEHRADRITLNSIMIGIRSELSARHPSEVKTIDAIRKSISKSASLTEMRVFRNNQLGHILRHETPQTGYQAIPLLINDLLGFLDAAFKICGDARWIGQPTKSRMDRLAIEFWDCIEDGAKARTIISNQP